MESKKGKCLAVSTEKGSVLLEADGKETWYTLTDRAKEFLKPYLKGQDVEFTLAQVEDRMLINFIKGNKPNKAPYSGGSNAKDDYWQKKFEFDKFYQALNSANRIVETFYSHHTMLSVSEGKETDDAYAAHKKLIASTAKELLEMQKHTEVN